MSPFCCSGETRA